MATMRIPPPRQKQRWKWLPARPLVPYHPSTLQPGKNTPSHAFGPSILTFAPHVQQCPDKLIRIATDLRDVQAEWKEMTLTWDALVVALYDSRHDEEKLDKLSAEMSEVAPRRDALRRNLKAKKSAFLAAAISHSRTYCRALSEKIVQSLPREVRDMIYRYLCDGFRRISINPPQGDLLIETLPPYEFSQPYLHQPFLHELASTLYQTTTFHIWDASSLPSFLHHDLLHAACPPKSHIRKISLVLFTDESRARCATRRTIREKLSHLTHLLAITHRAGFRLDLHLCLANTMQRPTVARFHNLLLPHLHPLRAAGFAMRFPLKTVKYGPGGGSIGAQMNQLQASESADPADWVVDEGELEAWEQSEYVRGAFRKSARFREGYLPLGEGEEEDRSLPGGFVDGEVGSDEEDVVAYESD